MAELVRERYEPLGVAGRGGQGEVLRALDRVHQRQVALKVRRLGTEEEREALLQEARVLLSARPHPNLPLLREDFFVGDRYFLVMDWIEGRDLHRVLEEDGDPGLSLDRVVDYCGQAAEALDHLHHHDPPIVHQDVKPANLVVTRDGEVVLVDFGISRRWDDAGPQRRRSTRDYAAPELAAGAAMPASDVYSLAATAYTLLAGHPPRPGERPKLAGLAEADGARVLRVLRRGLASDPVRRPPSARALVEAIRAAAPPARRPVPGRPRAPRRLVVATAAGVVGAALGAWALARLVGTDGKVPGAPSELAVVAESPTTLRLTWADNSTSEGHFLVERGVGDAGPFDPLPRVAAGVTTFVDTGLGPNRYCYRVRAGSDAGASAPTAAVCGATGVATIVVNEFMASNQSAVRDPAADDFDDWLELYNPGPWAVDIGGMYMTDDSEKPAKHRIPEGRGPETTMPPGSFLVIWADKLTDAGPLHTNFGFDQQGEDIGLSSDGETLFYRGRFSQQIDDVSEGRLPDGAGEFVRFATSTPGKSNRGGRRLP